MKLFIIKWQYELCLGMLLILWVFLMVASAGCSTFSGAVRWHEREVGKEGQTHFSNPVVDGLTEWLKVGEVENGTNQVLDITVFCRNPFGTIGTDQTIVLRVGANSFKSFLFGEQKMNRNLDTCYVHHTKAVLE